MKKKVSAEYCTAGLEGVFARDSVRGLRMKDGASCWMGRGGRPAVGTACPLPPDSDIDRVTRLPELAHGTATGDSTALLVLATPEGNGSTARYEKHASLFPSIAVNTSKTWDVKIKSAGRVRRRHSGGDGGGQRWRRRRQVRDFAPKGHHYNETRSRVIF